MMPVNRFARKCSIVSSRTSNEAVQGHSSAGAVEIPLRLKKVVNAPIRTLSLPDFESAGASELAIAIPRRRMAMPITQTGTSSCGTRDERGAANPRWNEAARRVKEGASCEIVAEDCGIRQEADRVDLELLSVEGPAGERVRQGESCDEVRRRFGFGSRLAGLKLEIIAAESADVARRVAAGDATHDIAGELGLRDPEVLEYVEILVACNGPASTAVRDGTPCGDVAQQYQIKSQDARLALEWEAIAGHAGRRVEGNESCELVARQHQVTMTEAVAELERRSVALGSAGKQARRGQNCETIAQKFGLRQQSSRLLLERMSIGGLAGMRVRHGDRCDKVASQYGIRESESLFVLENIAVMGRAGERVKAGESCYKIADEHGIGGEQPRLMLQRTAINGPVREGIEAGVLSVSRAIDKHGIHHPEARRLLEEMEAALYQRSRRRFPLAAEGGARTERTRSDQ